MLTSKYCKGNTDNTGSSSCSSSPLSRTIARLQAFLWEVNRAPLAWTRPASSATPAQICRLCYKICITEDTRSWAVSNWSFRLFSFFGNGRTKSGDQCSLTLFVRLVSFLVLSYANLCLGLVLGPHLVHFLSALSWNICDMIISACLDTSMYFKTPLYFV